MKQTFGKIIGKTLAPCVSFFIPANIFVSQAEVSECTKSNKNLPNMTIFELLVENVALSQNFSLA